MTDIHYWTAFGAGLLSFFSPCVLPLVPAYIANLAGASAIASNENRRMWPTLLHSISFILGFSILFILMGACAGFIGSAMTTYAEPIRIVSGIVVIIFGIFLVAAYKIPWLNYEKRLHLKQHSSNPGYIRSALIGAAFAVGWTPCIGPILGHPLHSLLYTGNNEGGCIAGNIFTRPGHTLPVNRIGLELRRALLERHYALPRRYFHHQRNLAYNCRYTDADQPAYLAEPFCNIMT